MNDALIKQSAYRQVAKHLHALQQKLGIGQIQKELFTIEEVAQILSVSERTVRELIERGSLKSVLIKTEPRATRGSRRISRAQLDAYIHRLEVEAKFAR